MKQKLNFRFLALIVLGIFVSISAMAQTITVKGHVQDTSGEPIMFGTVVVEGTTNGTNTDANGNFSIKAQRGAKMRFSYIGYKTTTQNASESMLVVLEDAANNLQEAVVIGYGVAKKNDLTGSVVAIKPDEKNHGLQTNATDMMQGKIAGVNVTSNDGTPGAGATIRVRGGSSLNASNSPLIVIDGIAMDNNGVKGLSNPLAMVNPNDIASFTVLKDASATAIYGSRGSNGVIIITTKKGTKSQKPRVSYNGSFGLSKVVNQLDLLNATEYRQFIEDYYGIDSEAYSKLGDANTNWQDKIYRTAIMHEHNLTLTGGVGGDKCSMPYRVSVGYTNQEGTLKTSEFERYTGSFNLNPTFLNEHLTFNINGKAMYANTHYANTSAVGAANRMDPTQPVYSNDPKYENFGGYFQWVKPGYDLGDPNWAWTSERNAVANPLSLLYLQDSHAKSRSLVGNFEIDYKVHGLEDLRLHANFAGDYSWGDQNYWHDPAFFGQYTYYGRQGKETEDKINTSFTGYLQYYKDFNEKHHFDIMGGYEWQRFYQAGHQYYYSEVPNTNGSMGLTPEEYAARHNSDLDHLKHGASDYAFQNFVSTEYKPWRGESYLVSFLGRANYILLDRYLFTATVRYDGSSRFYDHWALFPSFAFGWRIKDEKFLKDVDWVSELKLRLGYGKTGQQDGIGNYNYFASYVVNTNGDSYYPAIGNGTLSRPDAYNKNLKWETTTTYNAGLDFGIVRGKLFGSVDYYYRKTTDLINTAYVAAGSNFKNKVTSNIGSLKNSGVELALTYRPIQQNNWMWEITANATYNKNEITALTTEGDIQTQTNSGVSGTGNYCQAQTVGKPINSFFVYQQVYDENGLPLEGVFVDRDANGEINESDKYFYKSPAAPWTFGVSTRLQYKNWDFGFSLRASVGNYVYNNVEAGKVNIDKTYDDSYSYLQNRLTYNIPLGWTTYDSLLSDYFVQNASYLKCDNITLGYSFDNLFKHNNYKGISGRAYAAASNVFTISKYKGLDPECGNGIDNNAYPRSFSFQVGLNLNF